MRLRVETGALALGVALGIAVALVAVGVVKDEDRPQPVRPAAAREPDRSAPAVDHLLDLETGEATPLPATIRMDTRTGRNGYAISPDGSEVAYFAPADGANQVFVAHLDGTHIRQITHGIRATDPAWSPDGTKIAYIGASARDSIGDVFVIDLGSGETTQVTNEEVPVADPEFSPDGSAIVYTATERSGDEVRIVPIAGGKGSRLLGGPAFPASGASFSVDGSLMAYACGGEGLCVANADGSDRRMIGRSPGVGWIPSASWSPDGSRLAYWSFLTGEGVYVFDVETEETTRVADHARSGYTLAWPRWLDDHTLIIEIYRGR